MYSNIQEFSGDSDMANIRIYTMDDKSKTEIQLERYDPYGLIRMNWPKGKTPKEFEGSPNYTSFDEARRALDSYVSSIKS